jgi:hypothetical protein
MSLKGGDVSLTTLETTKFWDFLLTLLRTKPAEGIAITIIEYSQRIKK